MITKGNSQNNLFVSDPVKDTCNSVPSDHFVTLPDGCFEDGTSKNKVNVGKCKNHPCLRADTPFVESCDEAERCCQPGTVSEATVRCGSGEFKMERVLSCRCDICKERTTIVKGMLYSISTSYKKRKMVQIMIHFAYVQLHGQNLCDTIVAIHCALVVYGAFPVRDCEIFF